MLIVDYCTCLVICEDKKFLRNFYNFIVLIYFLKDFAVYFLLDMFSEKYGQIYNISVTENVTLMHIDR